MSVRIRAAAATCIISLCLFQLPAFSQQLTKEEEVAAQNFNGVDITGSSFIGQQNGMSSGMSGGQGMSQGFSQDINQNALGNSMMQNGLQSHLTNQNTQLGQVGMFSNGNMNSGLNSGMNNMPGMNSGMQGSFNSSNNGMNNGMAGNMQGNCAGNIMNMTNNMTNNMPNNMPNGLNNGMNSGGDIVQSIGNCIMNDPKMMQRAVGVAGAAALLGVFVGNGGIGGMMRSAGIDNTRHIRGSVVGY
jgi:hypothetical protein